MSSESLMREPKNRWRVPTRVIDRLLHLLQGHCRHRDPVKRKRLQVVVPACERKHSVVAQLAPGERNGLLRARCSDEKKAFFLRQGQDRSQKKQCGKEAGAAAYKKKWSLATTVCVLL
eukprot:TRINITY_DN5405_c0_g1_i2.p2 TRINITY_DN5405_c0_g1~~TRINITY_DN5405_c0_g1_i2.p2  ORF type:complete len:118 (+),score=12.38 TRINITY_DN5405_c0_g1_i2:450-803(+)